MMKINTIKSDKVIDYRDLEKGDLFSFLYGYEWSDYDNICLKCDNGYADLTLHKLCDFSDIDLENLGVIKHELIDFTVKRG